MTSSQIETILTKVGNYSMNIDIPLNEVRYIYLTTDGCLYPGSDTRFNFHKVNDSGVLMVYKGYTDENGIFIKKQENPTAFIDFAIIAGFRVV